MMEKRKVILALGSNYNQVDNMEKARHMLIGFLSKSRFSSLKWTDPINIISDQFLNCLLIGETERSLQSLQSILNCIEEKCGDTSSLRQKNIICMDIDILLLGDKRMHKLDWQRPYIQQLMNELSTDTPSI